MECGASIDTNAKFCTKCGANVNHDGVTTSENDTLKGSDANKANHPAHSQLEETTDSWPLGKILKCILLPKPKGSPKAGKKEITLRIAIALFFGIIVYQLNFAGKALPKCDAAGTEKTIENIINDIPILKSSNVRFITIKDVIEQGVNKNAEIRSCTATLVTSAGEDNMQYTINKIENNSNNFHVELKILE